MWFVENPQPLHQQEGGDDETITEEEVVESVTEVPTPQMSEDDPEVRETGQKMG